MIAEFTVRVLGEIDKLKESVCVYALERANAARAAPGSIPAVLALPAHPPRFHASVPLRHDHHHRIQRFI